MTAKTAAHSPNPNNLLPIFAAIGNAAKIALPSAMVGLDMIGFTDQD